MYCNVSIHHGIVPSLVHVHHSYHSYHSSNMLYTFKLDDDSVANHHGDRKINVDDDLVSMVIDYAYIS